MFIIFLSVTQSELVQYKAEIDKGFLELKSLSSETEIKLKRMKQQDKMVKSAMDDDEVKKKKTGRQLLTLLASMEKAEQDLDTLCDLQILERNAYENGSVRDVDEGIELDIENALQKLDTIRKKMTDIKMQDDALTERKKKGDNLRSRLARAMDAARSSLSLKKAEQRARFDSYLELKSRLDESSALKGETKMLQDSKL